MAPSWVLARGWCCVRVWWWKKDKRRKTTSPEERVGGVLVKKSGRRVGCVHMGCVLLVEGPGERRPSGTRTWILGSLPSWTDLKLLEAPETRSGTVFPDALKWVQVGWARSKAERRLWMADRGGGSGWNTPSTRCRAGWEGRRAGGGERRVNRSRQEAVRKRGAGGLGGGGGGGGGGGRGEF